MALVIGPAVVLILFAIGLTLADDNPATTAGAPATPTISSPAGMPPSAHDSLFGVINAGFQVLKPGFERSCYDCHSRFTQFPWYYKLPIIKAMIDKDIKQARHNVDFSNGFPFTGKGSQADMLKGIRDEISGGDMPPMTYRMIHWGRQIEGAGMESVINWIDSSLARLAAVGITPSESEDTETEERD
jgi:hypothetical protein